jgi:hypothetical protein
LIQPKRRLSSTGTLTRTRRRTRTWSSTSGASSTDASTCTTSHEKDPTERNHEDRSGREPCQPAHNARDLPTLTSSCCRTQVRLSTAIQSDTSTHYTGAQITHGREPQPGDTPGWRVVDTAPRRHHQQIRFSGAVVGPTRPCRDEPVPQITPLPIAAGRPDPRVAFPNQPHRVDARSCLGSGPCSDLASGPRYG